MKTETSQSFRKSGLLCVLLICALLFLMIGGYVEAKPDIKGKMKYPAKLPDLPDDEIAALSM